MFGYKMTDNGEYLNHAISTKESYLHISTLCDNHRIPKHAT